jgi:glycosyltransferase involved in cell wall biosynthesis
VAAAPVVSVILPCYQSSRTIRASLQSLAHQAFTDFEVIVVDSSPDDATSAIVRGQFPAVRYVHTPQRLLPHAARNHGACEARGRVLAFTDPDCIADKAWLTYLMAHHGNGPAMVGGAVGVMPGWWNRSVHAAKYPWWLPESEPGLRLEVPSGNVSVARAIWDSVGGFRGTYFSGDSELCWRVRRAGHPIVFEPRALVTHMPHPGPSPFVRERFVRGQDFGEMRLALGRWGRWQCLGRLLGTPIAPVVMTWRSARYAIGGRYLRSWLPTLPVQIAGNALWCAGEAVAHARATIRGSPVTSGRP